MMNNPGVRVRERIDKNHGDTVGEDIILPQKNAPYTAAREFVILPIYINEKICNKNE
jgi:hypothetical protein